METTEIVIRRAHRASLIQQLSELFFLLLGQSFHVFIEQLLLLLSLQQRRRLPAVVLPQVTARVGPRCI